MTELLTAAQMRAIEQAAIDSGQVTGLELMERAGQGVVDAILEWRPELATTSHRAVVLCGPGNNGGDGFVIARLLHQRGWEVEVFLYGDETKLPPDAAENARRWRELGEIKALTVMSMFKSPTHEQRTRRSSEEYILVDAVFGTGLSRPIDRELVRCLGIARAWSRSIVSVDVPSGMCADSGRQFGGRLSAVVYAALVVTFHRCKVGHFTSEGQSGIGKVVCKSIGLEELSHRCLWELAPDGATHDWTVQHVWNARDVHMVRFPGLDKRLIPEEGTFGLTEAKHKYQHGHALILSGGSGKGGAARLSARGALRIGAGLVTVGCPAEALTENAARLDAVMLAEIESVNALSIELQARKVSALCIGPGFGLGRKLRTFVKASLATQVPTVLDADALTEFRDHPGTLLGMLHETCVLTPHEGEFGRLFPDILARLREPATKGPAYSKVDATREAAKRAGCVVLFKGADTVIADPSGRAVINSAHYDRSAPWLATAGSGDVLAGFITGLLARGFTPMQAAETAAWLHVECALTFGPGLIAEDIPEQLPAVFRKLGL